MKTNDNLQEILNTLEQVRVQQYSNINHDILAEIVEIQYHNQEPERRANAKSETSKAIKRYIDNAL